MRFEEFVLRVPDDEFRIRFHERLTVLAGVGPAERKALLGSILGALTGGSDGTLTCVDWTGRRFELEAFGGRVRGRYADDGSSAPVPIGWFAPDAATLRELVVLDADDIGLPLASPRAGSDPPELTEARASLATVTAELATAS
ncbi:MAG: hypothetical protein H0W25_04905, partial [Acidimicrobiia bacterium]|nr:hypothetical protein [Acidimicrobiia bacterium]